MILTLDNTLKLINKEIAALDFGKEPSELYDPIYYIMSLGGKRMRPILAILSHNLFSDEIEKILKPAIAIELFHNYTLVHDDIMDNAPLRRGNVTVHEKWNTNAAILAGDVMQIKSTELLMHVEDTILRKSLVLFNKTATEICEGQQYDMDYEKKDKVSLEEYIEMIRMKTAVLLGFSLELGGLVAGADQHNLVSLREFGINMGIGFQLMDDLLDVYGDMNKFGKTVGGDIIANKKTYLLITALQKAKGNDAKKLQELLTSKNIEPSEKVKAVTDLYNKLEIKSYTELKINEYFDLAFLKLAKIDAPLHKKAMLKNFANKLAQREN
ncbi:MAG TPA: polyprenyl synthetase family protein [Cytophagaceae bacterium]|jgi:geranylgeranyl diphosphate synthase type II|nr:polyprenyl synthetase family protein [Cytophagaceae bacterium]